MTTVTAAASSAAAPTTTTMSKINKVHKLKIIIKASIDVAQKNKLYMKKHTPTTTKAAAAAKTNLSNYDSLKQYCRHFDVYQCAFSNDQITHTLTAHGELKCTCKFKTNKRRRRSK